MVTRTLLDSILGGNLWLFLEEPLSFLLFKTKGGRHSSECVCRVNMLQIQYKARSLQCQVIHLGKTVCMLV